MRPADSCNEILKINMAHSWEKSVVATRVTLNYRLDERSSWLQSYQELKIRNIRKKIPFKILEEISDNSKILARLGVIYKIRDDRKVSRLQYRLKYRYLSTAL